ncbi:hypothetical protein AXF42_Ash000051 [Apostasia shenzhenica]|uniref:Uncharacterized protein n=1 Tax=Apostasia shenzhenica TaxID=1088818 RepID=A0A2I0AFA7_9ASPA|nr:hypothetical protein AXF42_Ash000051 [Apostasia shenzhenica]
MLNLGLPYIIHRLTGGPLPEKMDFIISNASKVFGIRFTEPSSRIPFSRGRRTVVLNPAMP